MRRETDLRAPLFFLSYAHAAELQTRYGKPRERDRLVYKFFNDLSEDVADLVSRRPGADPGYLDQSIPGGAHWNPELLEAIGTCQVFVALLCAQYFASKWCSKEWHAFSQRSVVSDAPNQPGHQTAIVPVIWAPVPDDQIPAAVNRVQRFSPAAMPRTNTTALYKDHGVVGLLRMRRMVAYQGVVWQLAQHVVDLHRSHWVEPQVVREDDLRDIFRKEGA